MTRPGIVTVLALLLVAPSVRAGDDPSATLTVKVLGLKSEQGRVKVMLHASKDTFPTKRNQAYAGITVPINGHRATAVFPELPPGDYAVAGYHDEDNDGRLDRSVIGIPSEGTAASRDPKRRMGPPRWKDCVITVPPGDTSIEITIRY
jgi:uncharacterized protein (DUF2141 family)